MIDPVPPEDPVVGPGGMKRSDLRRHRSDEAMAVLEAEWPLWEFWLVPAYIGPTWWCARLRADHKRLLNAHSAAELAEYLEDAAAGSAS